MKRASEQSLGIDRTKFQVLTHADAEREDREFWFSRTPLERLQHVELLRELDYGSEVINQRLQRVLEVLKRPGR